MASETFRVHIWALDATGREVPRSSASYLQTASNPAPAVKRAIDIYRRQMGLPRGWRTLKLEVSRYANAERTV